MGTRLPGERNYGTRRGDKEEDRRPCATGPYGLSIFSGSTSIFAAPFPSQDERHGFVRPAQPLSDSIAAKALYSCSVSKLQLRYSSFHGHIRLGLSRAWTLRQSLGLTKPRDFGLNEVAGPCSGPRTCTSFSDRKVRKPSKNSRPKT